MSDFPLRGADPTGALFDAVIPGGAEDFVLSGYEDGEDVLSRKSEKEPKRAAWQPGLDFFL